MDPKDTHARPQVELTELMNQYTQLLCEQLRSARDLISKSVQEIMEDALKINAVLETGKREAEKAFEEIFLSPDPETQSLVEALQQSAGRLFDSAHGESIAGKSFAEIAAFAQKAEARFQTHISQFENVEKLIADALLKMTGSLTSDDVIAHYIRHVSASMHALEAGLSSILLDFEGRCTSANVQRLRAELYDFNAKQYSSTEERRALQTYFPKAS